MSLFRLSLLLLLATFASGQNPVPLTPPAPPAAADPELAEVSAQPAPAPAAPAPLPNPLANKKIAEDIIERKVSGERLAGLYRSYTGRRVIVTRAASEAEFNFVQQASPRDPLTFGEAAELLRKAAVLEGFVFTEHPDDPSLDILTMVAGGAPRPTNVGVDVFNEASKLPEEDVVITYVMSLNYIKPDQAVQIFTQVIGQLGAYGSISAVPNASAVVITEKASLIKSLAKLKATIDVPGSVQATRFIEVEHADATEVAAVLNELISAQQQAEQTAGVQRVQDNGGAVNIQSGGGAAGAGLSTPVQIVADTRTNRILTMGRPVDIVFVENLVREFDIPASSKTFLRRKLRFLTVSEFLPVAGDALSRAFSGTGNGANTGGARGSGQSSARPTTTTTNNNRRGNSSSSRNSNNSAAGFGGAGSGSSGGSLSLGDPNSSSAPESLLIGRTLLVADNITNSVIVQGPPSALQIIENLLNELDVKPEQVMISTVIGQLTLNNTTEFGLNYLMEGKDVSGAGGGSGFPSVIGPPDVPAGTFPAFNPASIATGGLRVYGQIGDLSSYLRALSTKTNFTVLSRPSIFTSNNRKGIISSGERIAIPTEGGTNTGNFSSGTRIQYEDVVLKLEVIPLVNSNNEITMEIALLSDEQNGNQTIEGAGTNGGNLTVPRISTREILTTATVPNNETIVLGGLIVGRTNKDKAGIPILSDIPLVGGLFSSNTNGQDRSELLVFIQPSVVGEGGEGLNELQLNMQKRFQVSERTREFADGPTDEPEQQDHKLSPSEKRLSTGPRHRR